MSELLAEESVVETGHASAPLSSSSALLATMITALWGTNPTALKIAMRAFPPIGSSGLRFAIAALGVWAWCGLRRVRAWPQRGEWVWLAVTAVLFIVQIATFTLGVYWGTAGHSIVLLHTYPFLVVAMAHFLIPGERASAGKMVGLIAAFGGIVALFAGEWGSWHGRELQGDAVQLFSAFVLAAQVVFLKHAVARVDTNRVVLWQMVAGGLVFLGYSLGFEGLMSARPGAAEVAAVLYQGLVIGTLCFTIWTLLIEKHAASRVAIFGFIAPLVGVGLSAVVLGEHLTVGLLVSASLVAIGIVAASKF